MDRHFDGGCGHSGPPRLEPLEDRVLLSGFDPVPIPSNALLRLMAARTTFLSATAGSASDLPPDGGLNAAVFARLSEDRALVADVDRGMERMILGRGDGQGIHHIDAADDVMALAFSTSGSVPSRDRSKAIAEESAGPGSAEAGGSLEAGPSSFVFVMATSDRSGANASPNRLADNAVEQPAPTAADVASAASEAGRQEEPAASVKEPAPTTLFSAFDLQPLQTRLAVNFAEIQRTADAVFSRLENLAGMGSAPFTAEQLIPWLIAGGAIAWELVRRSQPKRSSVTVGWPANLPEND